MLDVAGQGAGHRIAQRQELDVAHLHEVGLQRLQHLHAVAGGAFMVGGQDGLVQGAPDRVIRHAQADILGEAAGRDDHALGIDGDGVAGLAGADDAAGRAVVIHQDLLGLGVEHQAHGVLMRVQVLGVGVKETGACRHRRLPGARPQTAGNSEDLVLAEPLHAQLLGPLNRVIGIGDQGHDQLRIALIVAALEGLGVVPEHGIVLLDGELAAVVHSVHRAAGQDGVAANLGHLFDNDDVRAVLLSRDRGSQARAARADDDDVGRQLFVSRLLDDDFLLLHQRSGIHAAVLQGRLDGRQDRVGGHGRAGHGVDVDGIQLHHLRRDLRARQLADAGGVLALVHSHGLDGAVVRQGDGHGHRADAADLGIAGGGVAGVSHGQDGGHHERKRQDDGKNLLHTVLPPSVL